MNWVERILDKLFVRFDIGRGDAGGEYLTRWMIWGPRDGPGSILGVKIMLHHFHRSDNDVFHDHPWGFVSVILWGGYQENTKHGSRWYGPGRILVRPATWAHQVQIPAGKKAWSLVFTGKKTRHWGFWCKGGWVPWRQADYDLKNKGHVCGNDREN